jgi:hypothetical protein
LFGFGEGRLFTKTLLYSPRESVLSNEFAARMHDGSFVGFSMRLAIDERKYANDNHHSSGGGARHTPPYVGGSVTKLSVTGASADPLAVMIQCALDDGGSRGSTTS